MGGVCFATYEGFDGCVHSCRNAAAVLGGHWALVSRHGDTPASALDADVLFLSSWHERYEPILAQCGRRVVPRWHSTVLQTELGHEQAKIARIVDLLDRGAVQAVAVSDPEFPEALGRDGVLFLPEVLADGDYQGVVPAGLRGVHISLFGAADGRKNILVQSAAFERARRGAGAHGWTLHFNGQTLDDPGYARWLEAARIPYVDHGWLERAEYLSLVAAMDAGLCATLAESYCYVAADHVALGVPIVASPAIACLESQTLRARPDRVEDIADALVGALANPSDVAAAQRRSLFAQARTNADIARGALSTIKSRALTSGRP